MIRLRYKWHELGVYAKDAAKTLLAGVLRLAWATVLLAVNLPVAAARTLVGAIRKAPCVAVGVTFAAMLLLVAVTNMRMKARLTTAEWQRDRMELRLDSALTLRGDKDGYYRYRAYR